MRLREIEESLIENEKKYATLIEKCNDGIIIIQDDVIKFANSKIFEITGFKETEVIGTSFVKFVSPEYREQVVDWYKRRISGEDVPNIHEIGILSKDGKSIPVEINASLAEYEGQPADMVIIRDIIESKKAEEDLRNAREKLEKAYVQLKTVEEVKDNVIANVSHELRTPLTAAMNSIGLAKRTGDNKDINKRLETATEAL